MFCNSKNYSHVLRLMTIVLLSEESHGDYDGLFYKAGEVEGLCSPPGECEVVYTKAGDYLRQCAIRNCDVFSLKVGSDFAAFSCNVSTLESGWWDIYHRNDPLLTQPLIKSLPDTSLSASGNFNDNPNNYGAHCSRIDFLKPSTCTTDCWHAPNNSADQWIQVDLLVEHVVREVATRGRETCTCDQWVITYKVAKFDNQQVTFYSDTNGIERVFDGNRDKTSVVRNTMNPPLMGRRIRLYSLNYNDRANGRDFNCFKWELYGYNACN